MGAFNCISRALDTGGNPFHVMIARTILSLVVRIRMPDDDCHTSQCLHITHLPPPTKQGAALPLGEGLSQVTQRTLFMRASGRHTKLEFPVTGEMHNNITMHFIADWLTLQASFSGPYRSW